MRTLIDRVFSGSDGMYDLAVKAVDEALAKYGESEPVSFPETAYSLPCLYAFTGKKIGTYNAATGELIDDATNTVVAIVDMENGMVYPVANNGSAANE